MRRVLFAAAGFVAGFLLGVALPQGAAQDKPEGDKPAYMGDKACQKCHFKQHGSWKKTGMAKAMKSLEPTAEADNKELFEKKKKAGLDPAKDYTTDAKCLKCHTTSYGTPSGYPEDPKKDEAAEKKAKALGSVSCEACHGPGSLYVKYKNEKSAENPEAKFTFEDLAKYGLVKPDEKSCAACHNPDNPVQPAEPMKFEDGKKKVHDHPAK